ncbi:MAG: hypothetical protein WC986_14550 [Elusimicrobiota bacterium]|jgi:hypothetical protein
MTSPVFTEQTMPNGAKVCFDWLPGAKVFIVYASVDVREVAYVSGKQERMVYPELDFDHSNEAQDALDAYGHMALEWRAKTVDQVRDAVAEWAEDSGVKSWEWP